MNILLFNPINNKKSVSAILYLIKYYNLLYYIRFYEKESKFYLVINRLIALLGLLVGIVFCFGLFWWWIFIINLIVTKGHQVFSHTRTGKNGKEFKLLKFRSMRCDVDSDLTSVEIKSVDSPYTGFGKFLRKTSLNETLQ